MYVYITGVFFFFCRRVVFNGAILFAELVFFTPLSPVCDRFNRPAELAIRATMYRFHNTLTLVDNLHKFIRHRATPIEV